MHIAVQRHDLARRRQQRLSGLVRLDQHAAMPRRSWPQGREPDIQGDQARWRRCGARRVQNRDGIADDARRHVVFIPAGHLRQRSWPFGPLKQERLVLPRQDLRRALPVPPFHQGRAGDFLRHGGELEHGGAAGPAHRQQPAAGVLGREGLAIRNQVPKIQPRLK